jgi:hypothetical protein
MAISAKRYGRCEAAEPGTDNDNAQLDWLPFVEEVQAPRRVRSLLVPLLVIASQGTQ